MTFDFACKITIAILATCIENAVLRVKYYRQNRGQRARETKLATNVLKTDYTEVKKKNKNRDNHMPVMTATIIVSH